MIRLPRAEKRDHQRAFPQRGRVRAVQLAGGIPCRLRERLLRVLAAPSRQYPFLLLFTLDLTALTTLQFHGNNFAKVTSLRVENLPALTDFTTDYKCFRQAEVLFAKDPKLAHIRLGTGAMQEGTLTLEAREAEEAR